jgi:hypothetical protein
MRVTPGVLMPYKETWGEFETGQLLMDNLRANLARFIYRNKNARIK